jgi:hypothetical protein
MRTETFLDFLNDSVMGSVFSRYKTPALVNLDFKPTFTMPLLFKDFTLGLDAAQDLAVPMPLAAQASPIVAEAVGRGHERPPGGLYRGDAVMTATGVPGLAAAYRPARAQRKGLFIVLESMSGSGKSTLAALLAERLGGRHFHTVPAPVSDLQPYINASEARRSASTAGEDR